MQRAERPASSLDACRVRVEWGEVLPRVGDPVPVGAELAVPEELGHRHGGVAQQSASGDFGLVVGGALGDLDEEGRAVVVACGEVDVPVVSAVR